ncbi:MAG: LacI family DNA-binding transcriptional regulator [Kineosporiaceae bacterium]
MTRTAGIKDVARLAGVSVGTVSNVLNRPDRVSEATRARVQAAMAELRFVRNESARALRAGRSRTVGVIVLDVANPFFTDVAAGVEEVAEAHGAMTVLCNSGQDVLRERRYLDQLVEQRVLGILLTPVDTGGARLSEMRERGVPVVLVDRAARDPGCSVAVDDVLGGRLAVEHLLERGHERIAFVGGPLAIDQVRDRRRGAAAALSASGRPDSALVVVETAALAIEEGRAAGIRLAAVPADRRPTAAFCANDLLALGLLQEMTRRRIDVPGDLAIVGYDDIDFAAAAAVPLSSVRQPRQQLGRAAMELLMDEVGNPPGHIHRQLVFEPELVVRESTGGS